MSPQELAGLILTLLSISALTFAGIRWYVNVQLMPVDDKIEKLCEVIEDVRKETKTNGGSSMRDEIKAIKREQEHSQESTREANKKIEHMYELFVEYLAKNYKD